MSRTYQYNIYATLLDTYQRYLSSSEIYEKYWGFSENPSMTQEQFEEQCYQELIDKINRVKTPISEPAVRGIAFNELIDYAVTKKEPKQIQVLKDSKKDLVGVNFIEGDLASETIYWFDRKLVKQVTARVSEAEAQIWTEGLMQLSNGKVARLFGAIDYLCPFKVADVKTTKRYSAFAYRGNWQHYVYPFCLNEEKIPITVFEYIVVTPKKLYTEHYNYTETKKIELRAHVESFTEFLDDHRHLITDYRVWPELEQVQSDES